MFKRFSQHFIYKDEYNRRLIADSKQLLDWNRDKNEDSSEDEDDSDNESSSDEESDDQSSEDEDN